MLFRNKFVLVAIVLSILCSQADAQKVSLKLKVLIDEIVGPLKDKVARQGLASLSRSERNTLARGEELRSLFRNEGLSADLNLTGHLLDGKGPVGKIVGAADARFVEAQPGIVEGIQKLEQPISEQAIIDTVKAELLKTKETQPYVKFEVLSGKLSINGSIDREWGALSFGDVNLYNVTATVGGTIAACYELRDKNATEVTVKTVIEDCVANAITQFKSLVVNEMFKNASSNQVRALFESYGD
jgi:hypothetical protein